MTDLGIRLRSIVVSTPRFSRSCGVNTGSPDSDGDTTLLPARWRLGAWTLNEPGRGATTPHELVRHATARLCL